MLGRISKIEQSALKVSDIEALLLDKETSYEIYDLDSKQKEKPKRKDKRYDSRK